MWGLTFFPPIRCNMVVRGKRQEARTLESSFSHGRDSCRLCAYGGGGGGGLLFILPTGHILSEWSAIGSWCRSINQYCGQARICTGFVFAYTYFLVCARSCWRSILRIVRRGLCKRSTRRISAICHTSRCSSSAVFLAVLSNLHAHLLWVLVGGSSWWLLRKSTASCLHPVCATNKS